MTYRLVYTRRAERDIKKFDESIKKRIGETLLGYEKDPLRYAEKLTDPAIGSYRFRIGDCRVIFDVEASDTGESI